ncbi:MAG TPA: hypothetical protein ENH35_01235 [Candidatus Moranbacteria bacterium]|nr:hypothetical protein [Candidatus Moranbacteria bacterium]
MNEIVPVTINGIRRSTSWDYADKAREVLWNLINDTDSIIRITTFDKIEKILEVDKEFAYKLMNRVIEMNLDPKTVRRTTSLMERYEDS